MSTFLMCKHGLLKILKIKKMQISVQVVKFSQSIQQLDIARSSSQQLNNCWQTSLAARAVSCLNIFDLEVKEFQFSSVKPFVREGRWIFGALCCISVHR